MSNFLSQYKFKILSGGGTVLGLCSLAGYYFLFGNSENPEITSKKEEIDEPKLNDTLPQKDVVIENNDSLSIPVIEISNPPQSAPVLVVAPPVSPPKKDEMTPKVSVVSDSISNNPTSVSISISSVPVDPVPPSPPAPSKPSSIPTPAKTVSNASPSIAKTNVLSTVSKTTVAFASDSLAISWKDHLISSEGSDGEWENHVKTIFEKYESFYRMGRIQAGVDIQYKQPLFQSDEMWSKLPLIKSQSHLKPKWEVWKAMCVDGYSVKINATQVYNQNIMKDVWRWCRKKIDDTPPQISSASR